MVHGISLVSNFQVGCPSMLTRSQCSNVIFEGAMELEERPFSPADVVQDILKMALAATREKGIAVQAEVAGNVPNQVSTYCLLSEGYPSRKCPDY